MPFIIVFNIIMCVLFFLSACTIIYLNFIVSALDKKNNKTEEQEKSLDKYMLIRKYAFIVFLGLLLILIMMNLIF